MLCYNERYIERERKLFVKSFIYTYYFTLREGFSLVEVVNISVRKLVEFIFRSGDINTTEGSGVADVEAMQMGSRIHREIQKKMGPTYQAEVPLFSVQTIEEGDDCFELKIEGRADGIFYAKKENYFSIEALNMGDVVYPTDLEDDEDDKDELPKMSEIENQKDENEDDKGHKIITTIDEIKGVYMPIDYISEPVYVHKAQAMCYAYMVATDQSLDEIGVQITYAGLESRREKRFRYLFTYEEIKEWFLDLVNQYSKWAMYQYQWSKKREESIGKLSFPFAYREGQKRLVAGVYRTIEAGKKLFIEAPTGVGKTISTVYPAVQAMGQGFYEKLFYLTAKTITRTVAEECFATLEEAGLVFKPITITAKEKLCILEKPNCNPIDCERAKGHFDRVNDAVFDLLTNEHAITRELILEYSEKYKVCPYEMSLDAALFADGVICDYNYVFDPNVHLKRFFAETKKNDYLLLIDEAHNLVERGREMFSAVLIKEDFLEIKKIINHYKDYMMDTEMQAILKSFVKALEAGNRIMLAWKRECADTKEYDEFHVLSDLGMFQFHILRILGNYEKFLKKAGYLEERDKLLDFYYSLRHFSAMADQMENDYTIYCDYTESGNFRVKLQCMDPARNLAATMDRMRSTILFSATLLPIRYYREQLGAREEDYSMYATSSFPKENKKILIAKDVTTKYTRRGPKEYQKIAEYLVTFATAQKGNYLIFFPSYAVMMEVLTLFEEKAPEEVETICQGRNMSEVEREEFLEAFSVENEKTLVGFCVMGGIFSEGIDLKEDRLIGAAIVGTGLPMVCNERKLFQNYYDERRKGGFEYSYLYPGMNKVLQSGGRVIRTTTDRGVILLLDERFGQRQYTELFPREWFPYEWTDAKDLEGKLKEFWDEKTHTD